MFELLLTLREPWVLFLAKWQIQQEVILTHCKHTEAPVSLKTTSLDHLERSQFFNVLWTHKERKKVRRHFWISNEC